MRFGPDDEARFESRSAELESEFSTWLPDEVSVGVDPRDFGLLLHWKWRYGDGDLGRWRRDDISEFLLAWCPRKLGGWSERHPSVPAAVGLGMSFLADRGLLDDGSDDTTELVDHAVGLSDEFRSAMADPSNFGPTKAIFSAMGVDDLSGLDEQQLQQLVDEFNALPMEQRKAITDPAMSGATSESSPAIGPVRMPDEQQVRASAEAAPVLAKFDALADYLAKPGKILTAKGNLKIADARALAELLDTGDVYEEEIGDRTWRKRSSTQFVRLDHLQWWARRVGAVRQQTNRLVGVKAWQQRARKNPVAEVRQAFGILLEYGPLSSFVTWYYDPVYDFLDENALGILTRLLDNPGPEEYDDLLAVCGTMLQATGITESFTGQLSHFLERMLSIFEQAGVIQQRGAVLTPRQYAGHDRSGGQIWLTQVGTLVAVEAAQEAGVHVEKLPALNAMTTEQLIDWLCNPELEPADWWATVAEWRAEQPDAAAAFAELVEQLGAAEPLLLLLALDGSPVH